MKSVPKSRNRGDLVRIIWWYHGNKVLRGGFVKNASWFDIDGRLLGVGDVCARMVNDAMNGMLNGEVLIVTSEHIPGFKMGQLRIILGRNFMTYAQGSVQVEAIVNTLNVSPPRQVKGAAMRDIAMSIRGTAGG